MSLLQLEEGETPQTLDSLHLYHTALSSLSLQIPPPPALSSLRFPPSLPPSKFIPNTRFLIDAFRFSSPSSHSYFLSHFHSDHYSGLSHNWSHGIIFCSPTTASLLTRVLRIPSPLVFPLPLRRRIIIDGSEVTLVDANHCPGAVQFLFKVPVSKGLSAFETYVHTGDFRYCASMKEDSLLGQFVGCNALFLDTTYCHPKFGFPSQLESVDYVAGVIERIGGEFKKLDNCVLFLVATYVIGKEKILLEIARRCNRKVVVDGRKMEVLRVLGYSESGVFTEDESESDVHVVGWNVLGETWPYFRPNFVKMKDIMLEKGYSRVVGFVPTGWTYEMKHDKFSVRSKDSFEIHLVPYSEHSNYDELREYVKFLRPRQVVPTVGVDVENLDSKHANKMQKHFVGLVDEMANKKTFIIGFHRGLSENDERGAISGLNEWGKEVKSSDMEEPHGYDGSGVVLGSLSDPQEHAPENLTMLNDEEAERTIYELSSCLPAWVTRDQMLYLTINSGRNIVEAVTYFYEHETEFHDNVFGCGADVPASRACSVDNCESPSEPVSIDCNQGNPSIHSIQNWTSPKTKHIIKSVVSPGKRKRTADNQRAKKVKINSKLAPGGSKQPTIMKFFNKLGQNVSRGTLESRGSNQSTIPGFFNKSPSRNLVESAPEQCPADEKLLPDIDPKLYNEKIDQFIQIIGGNESSRGYAASILEKTMGDVNEALNVHYGNPKGNLSENKERLLLSGSSFQPFCRTNDCSSTQEENTFEGAGHEIDLSGCGSWAKHEDATLVLLPPDKYNPLEHACWMVGHPAPYIHLARTFELVEAEKGRIKAISIFCNMFRSLLLLSPEDVLPAVYLCTNKIAADHENVELNIGGSLVSSALEEACGTSRSKIREMYNNLGDLGDVAQVCRQTQTLLAPPPPLLIKDVFSVLRKISTQAGSGSTVRKKTLIMNLMRSCREKEMKFIVRTLVRNLRIGAMMKTVLPALAQAVGMNEYYRSGQIMGNLKEKLQVLSTAVVEAYNMLPNLDLLVPALINQGIGFSSSALSMVPGTPIKPMLAKITNGVSQVLSLFQNKAFTCEYKYDGQRAQIHKMQNGTVRIFSRKGDETTSKFPDLVNIIEESCKPTAVTFIVDAEVVAVDRKNSCKLLSFQELSSRERGSKDSAISLSDIKVDICVFIFDVMFANGERYEPQISPSPLGGINLICTVSAHYGLLEFPLRKRRKYLRDLFCDERLGYFEYTKEMTVEAHDSCLTNEATVTKINSFLQNAFFSSCEGIMVKSLDVDAGYSPSKRTDTWLKLKRDYMEGLNDCLDLVPIGAWHGNGRKAGWYSPFLMACYNPETEEFQSVCRVMSGFSDAFYREMKEFFSGDRILPKKPPYYCTAEVPDVWFSQELVWEIRGAEFSVSQVHQAAVGLVHPSRGISIRFPRFVRSVLDRSPEECTTAAEIAEMFSCQTRKFDVKGKS